MDYKQRKELAEQLRWTRFYIFKQKDWQENLHRFNKLYLAHRERKA